VDSVVDKTPIAARVMEGGWEEDGRRESSPLNSGIGLGTAGC
jgi:hypothetical protein